MNDTQLRLYAKLFQDAQDFRKSEENKVRSGATDPEICELFLGGIAELEDEARKILRAT